MFTRFLKFTGSSRVRVLCFRSVLVGPGRVSQKCSWGFKRCSHIYEGLKKVAQGFQHEFYVVFRGLYGVMHASNRFFSSCNRVVI